MSSLQMSQLGDLGYAQAIAAIVGPLAQGGAQAYQTYADSKQGKKELKQRQAEFEGYQKTYSESLKAQERRDALELAVELRKSQQTSGYMPYILGAVAIGGLSLVMISIAKGGRRGS